MHAASRAPLNKALGIMRIFAVAIFIVSMLSMSTAIANDKCGGSDEKYYDQALAYQLAKQNVPYTIRSGGSVCVDAKYSTQFEAAEREVANYFHEVAYLLRDSCEERAFLNWATTENLRFDIRPTLDSRKQPGRKMFLLRSFTRDDVVMNNAKLAKNAPKGATCQQPK